MSHKWIRIIVLFLLICAVITGVCLLIFTAGGQQIRDDPRAFVGHLLQWIRAHPISAMLGFFGLYTAMSLVLLPIWYLQMMCGFALSRIFPGAWGITVAVVMCQVAATLSAMVTYHFSHWLAADWFHKKVEAKIEKLRTLDEKLGHNGFLLVMAMRLMHMLPFAVSNYAFGMLELTAADVLIGTLLGGIPGALTYVTFGAHPRMVGNWRFITLMVVINVILLIPIILRYMKPQWFKRIGVE